jgi:hypothetical protein
LQAVTTKLKNINFIAKIQTKCNGIISEGSPYKNSQASVQKRLLTFLKQKLLPKDTFFNQLNAKL